MITAQSISEFVSLRCHAWGVDVDDVVLSKRRDLSEVVCARKALCWLLRYELHLSWHRIGSILHRDHTTAMHGVKAFKSARDNGEAWTFDLVPQR